ncbi:protein IMPACT-like [Rhynchophorus ferrugineus]|uniref:protein IMPACT-like n=1 Tax=Rhynchophorus ferrugineus TaxID=354439 RepID=UPI003FCC2A9A
MDNITQQAEELEVIKAIFGDQWKYNKTTNSFSIQITKNVELWLTLPSEYPSSVPPRYEVWAPNLSKSQRDLIDSEFANIYEMDKGEPVIYQWIEKFKDIVLNDYVSEDCRDDVSYTNEEDNVQSVSSNNVECKSNTKLKITHGSIITDRKSTFQGHVCEISSSQNVSDFLNILLENRKIAQATHNILAYRVKCDKTTLQDSNDDGESHAGGRLLHLLQILELQNVAVVVSRWYGGIHLGPDRFKHINNAARIALTDAGFIK